NIIQASQRSNFSTCLYEPMNREAVSLAARKWAFFRRGSDGAFIKADGNVLLWPTISLAALALAVPFLASVAILGFVPLSPKLIATRSAITALYVAATEILKPWFYRETGK